MKALYVALGDSLTVGYGVRPGFGFAEKYTQILQAGGKPFKLLNRGVNGLTVGGLNALLLQPGIALNVARSELITLICIIRFRLGHMLSIRSRLRC